MKSLTELRNEALVEGIRVRLSELNHERDGYLKLLKAAQGDGHLILNDIKKMRTKLGHGYYKGKHWTQRPENKDKLMKMLRKSTRTKHLRTKR